MSSSCPIVAREEEYELLKAFLPNEVNSAPNTLLIKGNPSTGKTLTLNHYFNSLDVNHSFIQCDQCVSPKVLWKRILTALLVDSKLSKKSNISIDSSATGSFQGFLRALKDIIIKFKYDKLHYIVLDRCDQIMEDNDLIFKYFPQIQKFLSIKNISIIFIINSSIPKNLITLSIPIIYFNNYSSEQIIKILNNDKICSFPKKLNITESNELIFWNNYVNLIVDSFFSYTTDILLLKRILIRLWDKFIKPIIRNELQLNEFHKIYRTNYKLLVSEYAINENSILDINEDEDDEDNKLSSNLSIISKYILVSAYIASFNDQKTDWSLFSKTRDIQRRRQFKRKKAKVNSRLLEASSFDLERLIAITHSIYESENSKKLISNLDFTTQIANLSSLKLLLKSHNQDFINPRIKWKSNVSYEFIKSVALDIGIQLENYLIE